MRKKIKTPSVIVLDETTPLENTQSEETSNDNIFQTLYLKVCKKNPIGNSMHSYVENSHEYNAQGVSEIHILTNNVINYDCTTLPLIAIQLNIAKGIRYFYYVPDKSQYNTLIYKVISGLNKSEEEIKNIDKWTRYHCSIAVSTRALLQEFSLKSNDEVERLLSFNVKHDSAHRINAISQSIKQINFKLLAEWLDCNTEISFKKIQESYVILKNISENIKILSSPSSAYRYKLLELIEHLSDLVHLSEYILTRDPNAKKEAVLERLQIPQPIIDWLEMKPLDEETIKDRLVLKLIEDASVCYNFCLILNHGGSVNGASWYLASKREQINVIDDNYVLLHIFEKEDAELIKTAFERL